MKRQWQTEGKQWQEKMQEFELTFYFKRNAAVFQSHRTFDFINVCVWGWILHPCSCAASARCWQGSWTQVRTRLFEQPGSEGYQIFISGTHSHVTFLQGNFVFASYPVPMTARSRSLFRTNAHSNVNVGRHEKNNPTGGSTLAVYMLQGGETAEDVTHRGVLWVKDHSAHDREGLPSSAFISEIQQRGAMKMFARSPLFFINARKHPSQTDWPEGKQQDREKKHGTAP